MRLIDKLVFQDLIGPFINGMLMFMMLLFAAAYLFPATELLVQGVPFGTVFQLVLLSLPNVVTQTFPMAMLLAGLLGFGRLSADREIVAIFAAGINFPRTARVVVIMGAIVSVVAFFWNDLVVPPASTAYWDLRQEAIKHIAKSDKPLAYSIDRKDGMGIEEDVRVAGGYDAHTHSLRHVTIIKYSDDPDRQGQIEAIVQCDRAVANDQAGLNWTYYDGSLLVLKPDKSTGEIDSMMPIYFRELKSSPRTPEIGKNFDEVLNANITDTSRLSFNALRRQIKEDKAQGRDTLAQGKEVDLYGKLSLPLASLIFGVVGAALGLNTQRGGGKTVGFGMAIFIVFLYWVFYHSMFVVGKNGGLPPILASFLADIVGAIAGAILAIRASR